MDQRAATSAAAHAAVLGDPHGARVPDVNAAQMLRAFADALLAQGGMEGEEASKLGLPTRAFVVLSWDAGFVGAPITCGPVTDPLDVLALMDLSLAEHVAMHNLPLDDEGDLIDAAPETSELNVHAAAKGIH